MERLLTPQEVSTILGIKLSTVYKYSMAGKLPTCKILGNLRFREDELENFVAQNSRESRKRPLEATG